MIDLTQGEGNKRVRKRNKKPTKGQLAAQAAVEAYRASARLPGQGEGLRPAPYPRSSHSHTRSQVVVEEDSGDDDQHQAPPVRTNFTTTTPEEPHLSELQNSALYQQPTTSPDRALLSNSAQSHPPSHTILDHDANIDPTLRISSKDGLSHAIPALMAALHQEIPPQRCLSPSSIQSGAIQLPMPVLPIGAGPSPRGQSVAGTPQVQQQAFANPPAQMIFTVPPLVPPHPPYNNPPLSHSGTGSQPSQVVSALHVPQHTQSLLRQHFQPLTSPPQPPNVQHQVVAVPQTAPAQGHQTPRLPPMRTLSESPAPSTPPVPLPQPQQPQPPSSSSSDCTPQPPPQRQQQQDSVTGFGRYARAPAGFSKPTFGKPAIPVAPLILPVRALPFSEKGKPRADFHAAGGDQAGDDEQRGRRRFKPPSPRPGIEYVHRAGGGLITARRTSERYDERTVDWINRLDGSEES
jgi:hypothetical protein